MMPDALTRPRAWIDPEPKMRKSPVKGVGRGYSESLVENGYAGTSVCRTGTPRDPGGSDLIPENPNKPETSPDLRRAQTRPEPGEPAKL